MGVNLNSVGFFDAVVGRCSGDARQPRPPRKPAPLGRWIARSGFRKGAQVLILSLVLLMALLPEVEATRWVQLGEDIDGESIFDHSGKSVSLSADGTRVAVGASENNGYGDDSGHVRVFEWNGTAWVQLGSDIDGEAAGDQSGYSVSLSADGSRVAIGAPYYGYGSDSSGHVRVFSWDGSSWVQLGQDIVGESSTDQCGRSVSLSADGSRVAVGSPYAALHGAGHVRVFSWISPNWVQRGSNIEGEGSGGSAGWSVSLSADGTRVAVGAPGNSDIHANSGEVSIYQYQLIPHDDWLQVGEEIYGEAESDNSGWSVSLSADGSILAIGAPYGGLDGGGHVRVFSWQSPNWIQLGGDLGGLGLEGLFGWAVSLSSDGSRVAAGEPNYPSFASRFGAVRVFEYREFPLENWIQVGQVIEGEAVFDDSGKSVSICADGSHVAVGAIDNGGNGVDSGHVRVFSDHGIFADGFEFGDTSQWSESFP